MNTHYDQIVQSISDLDIPALKLLLDDHRTYNEIPKNEFISRLSEVFDYFIKECRETQLVPVSGVCGFTKCINCKSPGIAFRGRVSSKYMILIIEVEADTVTDIYQCREFHLPNGKILKGPIRMDIYEEDSVAFVEGVDDHIAIQKCEAAINNLKQNSGPQDITFLYYSDLLDWVEVYDDHFVEVKEQYDNYRSMVPYIKVYDAIDIILTYLPNGAIVNIQESNDCYEEYKIRKPHLIPTWVKVLKPYFETHLPLVKYLDVKHIEAGYIQISSKYNIRLDISKDKPFLKFMINYRDAQKMVSAQQH